MQFESYVAEKIRSNTCQEVHTIPQEGKRGCEKYEGGPYATEVVEVLDGVHTESSKRFDVSIAVVQGMDVLVHCLDVDEAVSKIKVELTVEGHPEGSQYEHGQVPGG